MSEREMVAALRALPMSERLAQAEAFVAEYGDWLTADRLVRLAAEADLWVAWDAARDAAFPAAWDAGRR